VEDVQLKIAIYCNMIALHSSGF